MEFAGRVRGGGVVTGGREGEGELERVSCLLREWLWNEKERVQRMGWGEKKEEGEKKVETKGDVLKRVVERMEGKVPEEICIRALKASGWEEDYACCWLLDNLFDVEVKVVDERRKNKGGKGGGEWEGGVGGGGKKREEVAKILGRVSGFGRGWCEKAVEGGGGEVEGGLEWLLKEGPRLFEEEGEGGERDGGRGERGGVLSSALASREIIKKALEGGGLGIRLSDLPPELLPELIVAAGGPSRLRDLTSRGGASGGDQERRGQGTPKEITDPITFVRSLGLRQVRRVIYEVEMNLCVLLARRVVLKVLGVWGKANEKKGGEKGEGKSVAEVVNPEVFFRFVKLVGFREGGEKGEEGGEGGEERKAEVSKQLGGCLGPLLGRLERKMVGKKGGEEGGVGWEFGDKEREFLDAMVHDISLTLSRFSSLKHQLRGGEEGGEGGGAGILSDFQAILYPNIELTDWLISLLMKYNLPEPVFSEVVVKGEEGEEGEKKGEEGELRKSSSSSSSCPFKPGEKLYISDYSNLSKLQVEGKTGKEKGEERERVARTFISSERVNPLKLSPFGEFFSHLILALGSPSVHVKVKMFHFITQILHNIPEESNINSLSSSSSSSSSSSTSDQENQPTNTTTITKKTNNSLPPIPFLWDIPLAKMREAFHTRLGLLLFIFVCCYVICFCLLLCYCFCLLLCYLFLFVVVDVITIVCCWCGLCVFCFVSLIPLLFLFSFRKRKERKREIHSLFATIW